MSAAVDGRHLQVWSARKDEQAALGALGVTGAFVAPTDADPRVTLNGFSANRAGYFATTDVQVDPGTDDKGRPVTTVTVTVKNRAPDGPPSILLGMDPSDVGGKSLGTFATDVNVYLPKGVDRDVVPGERPRSDAVRMGRARGTRGELAAVHRAGQERRRPSDVSRPVGARSRVSGSP